MINARYKHLAHYWKGKDNPMYGKRLSEKHKKKISLALMGRPSPMKGRTFSKEQREKLSKARTGEKFSKKHRENISKALRGRRGPNASGWKGGRIKGGKGYIYVYCPSHPYATKQGYVMEHRLVLEKRLGRFLLPTEVSHHINEIPDDNRDENLKFFPDRGSHTQYHEKGKLKGGKQDVETT